MMGVSAPSCKENNMVSYSLVVRNVKDFKEYVKLSDTLKEFDLIHYVFEDGAYYKEAKEAVFKCYEEQMWSRNEGQMIIISEKYPRMTFELTCYAADSSMNAYKMYFKDGQKEFCTGDIVFEAPRQIAWDSLVAF